MVQRRTIIRRLDRVHLRSTVRSHADGHQASGLCTRHYPLRVTLDGATLYEGITPNSLGYVTIPLQQGLDHPITGSHLRVVLSAPAVDTTPSPTTAEITGKIDPTAVTRDSRAVLTIIEADIYR